MPLSAGDKLGPYEILAPIGAGGMGEVYRARDPRLKRDVAIKVSQERFSDRFEHEARAVAALNHPNICTLYDIGPNYLVMELIEGESPKGPMPLAQALHIARQIAEGLESAHEKGVVHRDLKPANIKIKPDGTVKVLDFGLAKNVGTTSGDPANSPTMTLPATHAGMILGTGPYMSPEQARGKTIDKRSDIWSFGVVLFELLTGRRLFQGEGLNETLALVIKDTPDLSAAPAPVRRLLESCLEKDPRNRLRDIGDWERLLESADAVAPPSKRAGILPWAIAAGSLLGAIGFGAFERTHFAEQPQVLRLTLPAPEIAVRNDVVDNLPAISPDGRHVALGAQVDGKVWISVRDLDGTSARLLADTEGANFWFWSPDSHWLAFFTAGQLKKIALSGGPALTLCEVANGRGGTWSRDGWIVYFRYADGLFLVPASGGSAPTRLTELDTTSETVHRAPWFLPDGRHFLYTARSRERTKSRVYVDSIDARPGSKTRREVLAIHSNAVFVPRNGSGWDGNNNANGYLLFMRENTLMAQPFDARKARITGEAAPVAEPVDFFNSAAQGQFAASLNGTLVYTSGAAAGANVQLTWFDRTGKPGGIVGRPGRIRFAALSPDGSRVATDREDTAGDFDIWLQDLVRGTESRLTFGGTLSHNPVWSPDGSRIGFERTVLEIWQKAADGTGQEEMLFKDSQNRIIILKDWSRDGRYLITSLVDPEKGIGILVVPTFGDRKPFQYVSSESNNAEVNAKLSPDGRFLAYNSNELKQTEVYVQTFPEHGGKWQISTGGGNLPVWSRDGRELYFLSADSKMMAVEVKAEGNKFEPGAPRALFPVAEPDQFDVGIDGRFLIRVPKAQTAGSVSVNVVVNWQSALKK